MTEIDEGVDAVKVALEDGYAGQHGLPKLTPAELKAIVVTAYEHNLPVSGHITQGMFLQPMLDAGVDDIAHMPYDNIPQNQELLRMDNEIGTLVSGKLADILIDGGNPLDDLQSLADVKMVIHNGTIIRDEIQKLNGRACQGKRQVSFRL